VSASLARVVVSDARYQSSSIRITKSWQAAIQRWTHRHRDPARPERTSRSWQPANAADGVGGDLGVDDGQQPQSAEAAAVEAMERDGRHREERHDWSASA
jgi:hypothetical protein